MNVGSLFAGIGGFDLGFERAGMRTVWQVEQSEFCRAVLARHFPDAERFEDVREVGVAELEPVDLICGGFPCQDISLAGRGAGIDGARSGLWSEYARIVRELEPRWVVVENVSALLGRGLDRVLRDLAEIGYDAEWDCLPASAFGAPHQRDRFWLVAYPSGGRWIEHEIQPEGVGRSQHAGGDGVEGLVVRQHPDPDLEGCGLVSEHHCGSEQLGWSSSRRHADGLRDEVANPHGERWHGPRQQRSGRRQPPHGGPQGEQAGTGAENQWATEPAVGRVVDGFPGRVDQLRALGNALVPQIAQWIGERIMTYEREQVVA